MEKMIFHFKILLTTIIALLIIIYISTKRPTQRATTVNPTNFLNNATMRNRAYIADVLELMQAEVMVEIGVQKAEYANNVLSKWPSFKHYYGVDPWSQQPNYLDMANVDDNSQELVYKEAKNRLKQYGDKITLIRTISTHAVKYFDDYSVDFVYIDARHDYCSTLSDLEMYYKKLKCNGILGGHDFANYVEQIKNDPRQDWSICEDGSKVLKSGGSVKGAVTDFSAKHKIDSIVFTEGSFASYFIIKKC